MAAMASSQLFHPSALSYVLLTRLSRQTMAAANVRRAHWFDYTSRPFSVKTNGRAPAMDVSAQARLSIKEGEIASHVVIAEPRFRDSTAIATSDLHFEAPLRIIEYPDTILRARNKRIAKFDENLKKLVDEMFDVMYKTDGIGLSAPQVGMNVQLLVFNPAGERGVGEELVLINPKVYKFSQKTVLFNEGCLSFPGIYADVERPTSLKVDARDISGARFTITLSGLPARVFQHEFDHLQGILFFDRMTEEVLGSIRPELQALEEKYVINTGLPSPEKVENWKRRIEITGFGRKEVAGFGRL